VVVGKDAAEARRLLKIVPEVPALTWGRDESSTGDMWNSNSLISWLLVRSGHPVAGIAPPVGGRAPGWWAGLVVAEQSRHSLGRRGQARMSRRSG